MITLRLLHLSNVGFARRLFSEIAKDESTIPVFFRPDVHQLLRAITNRDPEKVHKSTTYRGIGSGNPKSEEEKRRQRKAKIQLMTDEQLQKTQEKAPTLTHQRLQMPPVLPVREEIDEVLEVEERLIGIVPEGQKFVFIDISISDSISSRNRSMVSRGADGSLRAVNWADRDRLNSIYFPIEGQKVSVPLLFDDFYVKQMLQNEQYLYLLERACVQFEPDNPTYIRVRDTVFLHLLESDKVHKLDSTRHFGPLTLVALQTGNHDIMLRYFVRERRYHSLICYLQLVTKVLDKSFPQKFPKVKSVMTMNVSLDIQQPVSEKDELLVMNAVQQVCFKTKKNEKKSKSSSDWKISKVTHDLVAQYFKTKEYLKNKAGDLKNDPPTD